jgi:template-activating factor I
LLLIISFKHFSENPYFSDRSIKKVYKYEPSPEEGSSKLPSTDRSEEGVSEAELAFDWNEDIKPQV